MGGSKKSDSSSTSKTTFANTSQINPYYTTTTNSKGQTVSKFTPGTAGETTYNFVNDNISSLLDSYINPTLDSATNRAKLDIFNKSQQQNLQNNIINPLANNNMIRSSQATNMYNNLSNQSADYGKELIANNQDETWNMINNLLSLYQAGYEGASNETGQSINASLGTGTTTTSSNSKTK